jgi:hypothetical protein
MVSGMLATSVSEWVHHSRHQLLPDYGERMAAMTRRDLSAGRDGVRAAMTAPGADLPFLSAEQEEFFVVRTGKDNNGLWRIVSIWEVGT